MLEEIRDRGYVKVERLVPEAVVAAMTEFLAREKISEDRHYFDAGGLPPAVAAIRAIVDQAVGRSLEFWNAHVSIRRAGAEPLAIHVDGYGYLVLSGKSVDDLPWFRLLAGVCLVDLPGREVGNLLALPRGHLAVAEFLRRHDGELFDAGGRACDKQPFFAALNAELARREGDLEPIYRHRGDAVFMHSLVPHKVERNGGALRPALYFRLGRFAVTGRATLEDPLAGFS